MRTSGRILLTSVVSLASVAAGNARAQDVVGQVRGEVVGQDGRVLSGVSVTVRSPSLQGVRATTTDEHGQYRVLALPGGKYEVSARHLGYSPKQLDRVVVLPGQTTALQRITLEQRALEMTPVTVEAARHRVDPTTATQSAIVDSRTFANLPTDRGYTGIVSLMPQANQSYYGDRINISGATGWENAYYIDGVNVTDPYRAEGGIQLPYNFVDYIEVKTAGHEVADSRALGGTISVVTASGGNSPKGSAFAFFTNNGLSSKTERSIIDLRSGAFSRYDLGGSLGGPIVHDRLWYSVAYDRQVDAQRVELPGLTDVRTDRSVAQRFAAKVNWKSGANTDVALTVLGDPTSRDLVGNLFHEAAGGPPTKLLNPDPLLGVVRTGSVAAAVQVKHIVRGNTLLQGSFANLHSRFMTGGATDRGRTTGLLQDNTTWSGGYGNEWDHRSARTTADLSAVGYVGAHSFKGGLQYEENSLDSEWRWLSDQQGGTGPVIEFSPTSFVALRSDFRARIRTRMASLFGQTSLLVHPRLRLNAGLRRDAQYFKGRTTGLAGSIGDEWQPRVALIGYPRPTESEKLSASFARVYEQLPLSTASFWYGGLELHQLLFTQNPLAGPAGVMPVLDLRSVRHAVPDLEGQYYDEFAAGYERLLGGEVKLTVHATQRQLRQILTTLNVQPTVPDTQFAGNPGRGRLSSLPRPEHRYRALEMTLSRYSDVGVNYLASYVISRTVGNYGGTFDQDRRLSNPHDVPTYDNGLALINGTGPLPNDRPHVFKAFAAYRFSSGVTAGSTVSAASGTPLNEFGANRDDPLSRVFLQRRGTAGRTPSIWDWNFHAAYSTPGQSTKRFAPTVMLDLLHVLSARRPVQFEQRHFLGVDAQGNQMFPNPNYLAPIAFQPPMTLRLGVQLQRQ